MKKAITLAAIIFTVAIARAQFVSIPDTSFGDWLSSSGFSTCMAGNSTSGWRLDTACAAVQNATSMKLQNLQGVLYLQGIQYFKNLRFLNINDMEFLSSLPALPPALDTLILINNEMLTSIPALPVTLKTLICNNNQQVSRLPALPDPLTYLDCSMNNLSSLPILPTVLVYLNCGRNNELTTLSGLPSGLKYLNCGENMMTSLPPLPGALDTFICSGNMFTSIPTLPVSLTYLDCWANHNLSVLPSLPPSLTFFNCSEDPLGNTVPTLPPALTTLMCFDTRITSLPALPGTLTYIDCSDNSLVFIPALPDSLAWFDCSFNPDLNCMPHLNAVVHLNFTNTGVSCIPDLPTSNTYTNPTVPVCSGNEVCATGIDQVASEHFSVYPNPASKHFVVENSAGTNLLRLSNILGQTVYNISGNSEMVMQVDVSHLQAGIYIIEAYSATGSNTAKVIVGN